MLRVRFIVWKTSVETFGELIDHMMLPKCFEELLSRKGNDYVYILSHVTPVFLDRHESLDHMEGYTPVQIVCLKVNNNNNKAHTLDLCYHILGKSTGEY